MILNIRTRNLDGIMLEEGERERRSNDKIIDPGDKKYI